MVLFYTCAEAEFWTLCHQKAGEDGHVRVEKSDLHLCMRVRERENIAIMLRIVDNACIHVQYQIFLWLLVVTQNFIMFRGNTANEVGNAVKSRLIPCTSSRILYKQRACSLS